eukprot:gnl/TRDRNA2_/TRDRNA2_194031_c0_seq1.p1 gnl/TRDRNA2_/TRDRNA2_194031_c0~~gnl/TRDRNA2_/TRDRNA2_194031_c0_seq1.p1  ORF type:complete len:464 (+),score=64.13 gnl/TRDRNA2_/TRDRNA2_194031_c0_seq1:35-1426(+)
MVKLRAGFPAAEPEREGLNPTPLARLKDISRDEIHKFGALAGVAHIVLRRGRCVFAYADGWADRKRRKRFALNTICKLHGCTKPLVAAAFLTLVDEGRVRLSDPVEKYIPFSHHVAKGKGARARKASVKPTLLHLLTQTAGLAYEDCPAYASVMKKIERGDIKDLKGLCDGLASKELQCEPGSRYTYSFCTDVLGRVCEAASGEPLESFVTRRLLQPLKMKDTHFVTPKRKRQQVSLLYDCAPVPPKKLKRGGTPYAMTPFEHPLSAPGILSSGGGILSYKDPGMLSTVQDYARFCQMILNGGVGPDGRRVLRPATARSLWSDSLATFAGRDGRLPGWNDSVDTSESGDFWDLNGWTLLNTHVRFDRPPVGGSKKPPRRGHTMWMGGGGGTYWVIDKRRKLVCLSFSQSFGGREETEARDVEPFAVQAVDTAKKRPCTAAMKKLRARAGAAAKKKTKQKARAK